MKNSDTIDANYAFRRQQILDTLLVDVEQVRRDAQIACSNYSISERDLLASIETDTVSSIDFLYYWQNDLKPRLESIGHLSDEKTFTNLLTKSLLLMPENAKDKIGAIIKTRQSEIIQDFLYKIYPCNTKHRKDLNEKPREHARHLLEMPEEEIIALQLHQLDYMLYKEITEENDITIIDLQDSWFTKLKHKSRIKSEQRQALIYLNERYQYINNRLDLLASLHGGLIVGLFEMQLDLVSIFDLRHQYEKKLVALSSDDKNNAVKRLALFDTVTDKYKRDQAKRLTANLPNASLESTRSLTRELDKYLMHIFDLTNTAKNQLMLFAKEYRELNQELSEINNKLKLLK